MQIMTIAILGSNFPNPLGSSLFLHPYMINILLINPNIHWASSVIHPYLINILFITTPSPWKVSFVTSCNVVLAFPNDKHPAYLTPILEVSFHRPDDDKFPYLPYDNILLSAIRSSLINIL